MNLLELIRVSKAMLQTSRIQTFISKFKKKKIEEKEKRKHNKRTRRRNKKIKTSINKSKCISCQKMFHQITKNEKHTVKNK